VITTTHVLALAAIGRKTVEGDRPGVPKVWKGQIDTRCRVP